MRLRIFLIGCALLVGLTVIRAADPGPVQDLRNVYFDTLQRLAPRDWQDLPIRVVDIDEASLAQLGQWPWPRTLLAEMVDRLNGYGAAVVAFDVLFAEPDRYSPSRVLADPAFAPLIRPGAEAEAFDSDAVFAEAMTRMPVVLGVSLAPAGQGGAASFDKAGLAQIGRDPLAAAYRTAAWTPLVPALQEAATGIGSINVSPSANSGTIRQVPMLWQGPEGAVPALAVEALRTAMGESTYILRGLGDLERVIDSLQVGGYQVPLTDRGAIWLHYRPDDPRLYVSAADLLREGDNPELRAQLEGMIVLVGTSAAGLLDIRTTALGESVPGVSIHAQVIEQILTEDYLIRTDFIAGIELASLIGIGLLVTLVMTRFGPIVSITAGGVAGALVLGASWVAFGRGILMDASFPVIGGAVNFAALAGYQFIIADREKRMVRRSFSQYLAPSVLSEIERSGYRIELGGEMRDISIMFADMRNYTSLSETLPADQMVALLNDLFTDLTEEILTRDGTIDKYIGDSIMALWNAPLPLPGHEGQAARAALGMRERLAQFVAGRADLAHPIEMAIGLAAGTALVGNIGSRQRFNYSALGDTVNLASRAETSCRALGYDIVATQAVVAAAPDLAWLFAGHVSLKGKAEDQALFVLVGDEALAETAAFRALKDEHARQIARFATGQAPDPAALQALARSVQPGLASFYDRLPKRADDFQATPPAQITSSST